MKKTLLTIFLALFTFSCAVFHKTTEEKTIVATYNKGEITLAEAQLELNKIANKSEKLKDLKFTDLKKDQQSSNWGADSLTDAQQNYAANDVLYLHSLRNILNQMLDKNGRRDVFSRYCSFINTICDSDLAGFNEDLFRCIGEICLLVFMMHFLV
jgi:ribonuclease D